MDEYRLRSALSACAIVLAMPSVATAQDQATRWVRPGVGSAPESVLIRGGSSVEVARTDVNGDRVEDVFFNVRSADGNRGGAVLALSERGGWSGHQVAMNSSEIRWSAPAFARIEAHEGPYLVATGVNPMDELGCPGCDTPGPLVSVLRGVDGQLRTVWETDVHGVVSVGAGHAALIVSVLMQGRRCFHRLTPNRAGDALTSGAVSAWRPATATEPADAVHIRGVLGGLRRADVVPALRPVTEAIQTCHRAALVNAGGLVARISARLHLSAAGSVAALTLGEPGIVDERLEACVEDALRSLTVRGAAATGITDVVLDLELDVRGRRGHPMRAPAPPPPAVAIRDEDGSGVPDNRDECPSLASGDQPDPTRRGCPRSDWDSDGILDDQDRCPNERAAPGVQASLAGCPPPPAPSVRANADEGAARDADRDGVADGPGGPDRCPTQPETYNAIADDDGCPDGEPFAQREGNSIRLLRPIRFRAGGEDIVGVDSFRVMAAVASLLRTLGSLSVDIQGHTDDRGDAVEALGLSNRRALAVRGYLIQRGVEESRLEGHGFGPNCPISPGTSDVARAVNERIQMVLVTPDTRAGRCNVSATGSP